MPTPKSEIKGAINNLKHERARYLLGDVDFTYKEDCDQMVALMNREIYLKVTLGEEEEGQYKKCIAEGISQCAKTSGFPAGYAAKMYKQLEEQMTKTKFDNHRKEYGPHK